MTTSSGRLESLDVFRGVTIAAMILVSTPGTWESVYSPLDHAAWNGWTPTDLVFPFLLFAKGAAVPEALKRHRGVPQAVTLVVVRRALLLFGLGLLLNAIEAKPPIEAVSGFNSASFRPTVPFFRSSSTTSLAFHTATNARVSSFDTLSATG